MEETGDTIHLTKGKSSDEWWLPQKEARKLEEQFDLRIELDVACKLENALFGWGLYHDKGYDALKNEWILEYPDGRHRTTDVWCNPPLSKTKDFVLRALQQWKKHDINILMLIPSGVISRKYFRDIWYEHVAGDGRIEVHPIDRPKFSENGKESKWSARNDYMVLLFKRI